MAGHGKYLSDKHLLLKFNIAAQTKTVIPFGIPDINEKTENAWITFNYILSDTAVDSLLFEVIDEQGTVIYSQLPDSAYTLPGTHQINWDGFDNDDIYDSSRFIGRLFHAKITAVKQGVQKC